MKNRTLILISSLILISVSLSSSNENEPSNDDFIASIKQEEIDKDATQLFFEIPIFGNGTAFLYPSRIFAFKIWYKNSLGILFEPIVGYNSIKGIGASSGFFMVNGDTHYDFKGIIYDVSGYDVAKEIYFDIDHYLKSSSNNTLVFGGGIGIGINSIGEETNSRGTIKTFETGATLRLHFDYVYRRKI